MTTPEPSAYKAALKSEEVPAALNERVLTRANELRLSDKPGVPTPTPPRTLRASRPGPLVSRRALVTGGAALAGAAVLGLGLRALTGREAVPSPAAAPRFGLQVALAAEGALPATTFELEPTTRGLIPVDTMPTNSSLIMNLLVEGDDIESVTYRIDQTPTVATAVNILVVDAGRGTGHAMQVQSERPAVAFCECKRYASHMAPVPQQPLTSFEEAQAWQASLTQSELIWGDDAETPNSELEIDYSAGPVIYVAVPSESGEFTATSQFTADARQQSAANGVLSPQGNPYMLSICIPADEFYASDPLLELYCAYQTAALECGKIQQEELLATTQPPAPAAENNSLEWTRGITGGPVSQRAFEAQGRLLEAQSDLAGALFELRDSHPAAFYEWVRACYVKHMLLVAQVFSKTTFAVEATFADGSAAVRSYCIDPVGDFESVVGERFDGLFAYNGYTLDEAEGVLDPNGKPFAVDRFGNLPFWDFAMGEPDPQSPDPRLHQPLFTITDVTV